MFGFSFTSWFRSFTQRKSPSVKTARPWIDVLEDRAVPAVGTGVISGHALVDVTGNGLSADDVAQKGVLVRLQREGPHGGFAGYAITDANGGFSFDHLAAGKYKVYEYTPKGFIQTGPETSNGYVINLVNGQTSSANDFDNFKRVTDGRLSKVTYTVVHDGVAKTYNSLAGHTHAGDTVTVNFTVGPKSPPITLSLAAYNATGNTINAKTLNQDTLADSQTGTFGPGQHSLTVTIPNNFYQIYFVRGPVIDHFGPARSNISYSDQYRLIAAAAGGATVQVQPSTISGHVINDVDHDGTINAGDMGIGGALVTLTGTNDLGQAVNVSIGTDADGNYSFAGLRPGTYAVAQTVPDNFTAEADFLGTLGGNPASLTTIDHIVVTGGQTGANYDFLDQAPLSNQPGSISGNVTKQPDPGGDFVPADGATVRLIDSAANIVATVTTDGGGNYSFTGVATGAGITYTVMFVRPDSTFNSAPSVQVDMFDSGEVVTDINAAFTNRNT